MSVVKHEKALLLSPGEVFFGHKSTKIKTILGSCVAITVWHKKKKLGGMCHFLIAQRRSDLQKAELNYRYGEDALSFLLKSMNSYAPLHEFELKLFGGANMYTSKVSPSVGESNINFATTWAEKNQLTFAEQDILAEVSRSIIFDLSTGIVELQKYYQGQG